MSPATKKKATRKKTSRKKATTRKKAGAKKAPGRKARWTGTERITCQKDNPHREGTLLHKMYDLARSSKNVEDFLTSAVGKQAGGKVVKNRARASGILNHFVGKGTAKVA